MRLDKEVIELWYYMIAGCIFMLACSLFVIGAFLQEIIVLLLSIATFAIFFFILPNPETIQRLLYGQSDSNQQED